ncbi:hypothetical protein [Robertkochia solimangrovi]|uniref:hypothetical protein n=1 Tax=Robertkochia solimangrovi TaxID=2213046 RepID=UPI00117F5D46|nr:hypothetical protein [Robertkochia solimangrovi]TRZ44468.1 hypothetical protein DMZ48_08170 [Robertkochia solimangrovi]
MRMINTYKHWAFFLLTAAGIGLATSCSPEDPNDGNGLSDPNADASFTITPVDGEFNHYLLKSGTENVVTSNWKVGSRVIKNKFEYEIFLPDAGTYEVVHEAIGRGGLSNSASQELVVDESDPVAGNLVKGGRFDSEADIAEWTILEISASGAEWVFSDGSATIHSNGGWAQQGLYQAIEVEGGRTYTIDMAVRSSGSFDETWFEVYAGTTPPVNGTEYADTKIMGLSTWDGCALTPFEGSLSEVGCVKNSQTDSVTNTFTPEASGTIYLVIRCGGNTFSPEGITIDDVELRGS